MLAETGHYTGTFRLARSLRAQGRRVVYVGTADFAETVRAQGFEFVAFAEDLLPAGYLRSFAAALAAPPRGLAARVRKRRADEALFAAYLRRVGDGSLDALLLSCRPDLLICDTFLWHVALRALAAGIPTLGLSPTPTSRRNWRVPPVVTGLPPGTGWPSRLVVRGAWAWLRLKFLFTKRVASRVFGSYRHPHRMHHLVGVFLDLARRSGYPLAEGRTWWFGEIGPRLALPEILLCPRAFQFPGAPADETVHLGDFIDVERREAPLEDVAADARPLVYCSLGTSAFHYPHAGRFFRAVAAAAGLRPDWRFVLHAGAGADRAAPGPLPPNLTVVERAPQLALLRRAAVMVSHGGFQSVLECVRFGVPLVIYPGLRDQPGIAARAAHHGIALTGSMARVTPGSLVALAERAMADAGMRAALARLRGAIDAGGGLDAALRLIGGMLERDGAGPARARGSDPPPGSPGASPRCAPGPSR
jgi:UDP:flavonoid glycosyltransferase YjiC (YdhE family)